MSKTNKDKDIVVDESILEETPPNINEPQNKDEDPDNQEPVVEETPVEEEVVEPVVEEEKEEEPVEEKVEEETQEEKDKRYKAQQTEAQIQAAKNKALQTKVEEAKNLSEPTVDELKAAVSQDGFNWDELTPYEQVQAKKAYIADRRFNLINDAVVTGKQIDDWAGKVDSFIDTTDGKPAYIKLSGHEAEFRRFAMQEAHRGVDIQTLLLPAFLQNLPAPVKKRGSLFEVGGGGEKAEKPGKLSVDEAAQVRATQGEKAYKALIKAGKVDDSL